MIILLLYLIGIRILLVNTLGPRNFTLLDNTDLFLNPLITENQIEISTGRIFTALFLMFCISAIIISLLRRKFKFPLQGMLLTIAGLLLYAPAIISSLVSDHGGFSYKLFFFPLFMITAYLLPRFNPSQKIKIILPILSLFIFSSLLVILFDSNWAVLSYSESWLGIPIRLYGTSSHPNGLGNIGLSLIILARISPKKNFWHYLNIFAAIIIIILAQSKAVWITIIVWLLLEWIIRKNKLNQNLIARNTALVFLIMLCIITYMLLFQKELIYSITSLNVSLTGRIDVWQITVKTWLENPIFGYGPNIWDYFFRQGYGFVWAGQAHNQFLQTLGESGLVGIATLIFYFIVVIILGSKYSTITNFSSYGIVIAFLTRSLFETPLRNYNLDEGFLVHALFFVILINCNLLKKRDADHKTKVVAP